MHCNCYYVSVMDILTLPDHSVRSSISAIGRVPCSNNPKGGTEATRASQRRRPKLQFQAVLEVEEVQLETQLWLPLCEEKAGFKFWFSGILDEILDLLKFMEGAKWR